MIEVCGGAVAEQARQIERPAVATPWEGVYSGLFADTFYLAGNRYTASKSSCCGTSFQSVGTVAADGDRLHFEPSFKHPWRNYEKTYRRIRWGTKAYLVEEGEMLDFCALVNGVWKFDRFASLTVDGDFHVERPELPREFEPYLLEAPVHGRVVKADEPVGRSPIVTLDIGSEVGLRVGHRLRDCHPFRHALVLDSVEAGRAVGHLERWNPEFPEPVGECYRSTDEPDECPHKASR